MGLYHCLSSSCATVHYREYLPPVVRWRYPGKDWQEIEGDDYAIKELIAQCSTLYNVYGTYENKNIKYGANREIKNWRSQIDGPITGVIYAGLFAVTNDQNQRVFIRDISNNGNVAYDSRDYGFNTVGANVGYLNSFVITHAERVDNQPDNCGDCVFTITLNEKIVHTETRDVCPIEVEILPCRLSDEYKQIKINKYPFLDVVRVIDYAFVAFGLNVFRGDIPAECLNIYNDSSTQIVPLPGGVPTPNNGDISQDNSFGLISQICSSPGCPPPEYEVVCECRDECPPGTCAVRCGSFICCYGSDGKSQAELPLSNFFPTNTSGGNSR